jgi:hypothetical protein
MLGVAEGHAARDMEVLHERLLRSAELAPLLHLLDLRIHLIIIIIIILMATHQGFDPGALGSS